MRGDTARFHGRRSPAFFEEARRPGSRPPHLRACRVIAPQTGRPPGAAFEKREGVEDSAPSAPHGCWCAGYRGELALRPKNPGGREARLAKDFLCTPGVVVPQIP